ncbi:MAG TPA: cell division protein ZapA [Ramlibacter sp.]|nr:cell division protein ZapA [Ramlibacter sp.]
MKQLEVQIMGQSYLLGCPEGGEARLLEAVEKVDTAMCRIRDAGKVKARDRIAVLAALNLAFDVSDREAANGSGSIASDAKGGASPAGRVAAPAQSEAAPDPRLASLLQRLDAALGDDGRLL